jgi:hypothetical protein
MVNGALRWKLYIGVSIFENFNLLQATMRNKIKSPYNLETRNKSESSFLEQARK